MKMSKLGMMVLTPLAIASAWLGQPGMAIAEEKSTEQVKEEQTPAAEEALVIGNGQPIQVGDLGVSITPPMGWEVSTKSAGLSLVMREPKAVETGKKDYSKPIYQRNITMAVMHQASAIDEKRAGELKEQMAVTFGKDPMISDFQVVEHKFFNYRGTNDGLIVYSSLKLGEFNMMQMHVLVSGSEKQYLLTYTDLANEFSNQANFEKAWSSMVSIDVPGIAPKRYQEYAKYGIGAGAFLILFSIFGLLRRRSAKMSYDSAANEIYGDESSSNRGDFNTISAVWSLKGDSGKVENGPYDFGQSFHSDVKAVTNY